MFDMASTLEGACIDLTLAEDLLNILQDNVFWAKGETSDYAQQYGSVLEMALRILHNQEQEVRKVSDMLYEINREMKVGE